MYKSSRKHNEESNNHFSVMDELSHKQPFIALQSHTLSIPLSVSLPAPSFACTLKHTNSISKMSILFEYTFCKICELYM